MQPLRLLGKILVLLSWCSLSQAQLFAAVDELGSLQDQLALARSLDVSPEFYQKLSRNFEQYQGKYAKQLAAKPGLKKELVKWKKIAAIQAKFRECLDKYDVENSRGRQLLATAISLDPDSFDCGPVDGTVAGFLEDMDVVREGISLAALRNAIGSNVQNNLASSLASIEYQVADGGIKPGIAGKAWARDVRAKTLNQLCPKDACTPEQKRSLSASITKQLAKEIESGVVPLSVQDAADRLNADRYDLDTQLRIPIIASPPFPEPRGLKAKQALKSPAARAELQKRKSEYYKRRGEEEAEIRYQAYVDEYWERTSSGYGILANVAEVQKKFGAPKKKTGVEQRADRFFGLELSSEPDKKREDRLNGQDLRRAKQKYVRELASISAEERKERSGLSSASPGDLKESLKKSIKNYPLAAAQTLAQNPGLTGQFCDILNELDEEQETAASRSRIRDIALAAAGGTMFVVGAAVTATGVGSPLGVSMMIAGGGLTAYEAGSAYLAYDKASEELEALVQGQLAGSGIQASLEDKARLKQEASDAALEVGMAVGFGAVGATGLLRGVRSTSKLTGAAGLTKENAKRLRQLGVRGDFNGISKNLSQEELGEFAGKLVSLPPKDQAAIIGELRKLNSAKASPSDYRSLNAAIDQSLCN